VIRQAEDVRLIFGTWDWKQTKPVTEYVATGQQIGKCRYSGAGLTGSLTFVQFRYPENCKAYETVNWAQKRVSR